MPIDVPMIPSDEDLMKLCQEGNQGALLELFSRYEAQTISFIYRLIRDEGRAQELAQKAFFHLIKESETYKYPRNFSAWYYFLIRQMLKGTLKSHATTKKVASEPSILQNP